MSMAFPLLMKLFFFDFYSAGSFSVYAYCIADKGVLGHETIADFFQQNAIGRPAPILFKGVFYHFDVLAEHHGHPCSVSLKGIFFVGIVVGEHEMQSVPHIVLAGIAPDQALIDKLKNKCRPGDGSGDC